MQAHMRPSMAGQIRILLVDDQPEFRDFAAPMLDDHPDLQVVGQASTGAEALEKVASLRPDVVIVDVQMPGMNGFETTKKLLRLSPSVHVIIVSADDEPAYEGHARRAGAVAFLNKMDLMPETVVAVLEELEEEAA